MKAKIVAAAIALPMLAGCGTAAAAARHGGPVASPSTHAAPKLPPMTHAQRVQECAALAIVKMGDDTYANQVNVMAGQYTVPKHVAAEMIARTVKDTCPSEVSVLP